MPSKFLSESIVEFRANDFLDYCRFPNPKPTVQAKPHIIFAVGFKT